MVRRSSLALVAFVCLSAPACIGSDGASSSYPDGGSGGYQDAGSWPSSDGGSGGGNISLGGAEDFGYFRKLLDEGIVPTTADFDAAGFFAEHHLTLPPPDCGERVCLQAMLGVMSDLIEGAKMSMLQLGLNTPVTIDPDTRPPLDLAVVVDVSGSMDSGDKIGFVRLGLTTLIDNLADDDRMALVTYNDTAQVVAAMAPVGEHRQELLATADSLQASGSTNFYDGLEMGYTQVLQSYDVERQARVILLSDGMPTAGNTNAEEIMSMSAGYNSEGLAITTVGLGTSFNAELMRGLAEQGHGNHYFLESTVAIDEVFAEEISYFTVPVAFDVTLNVRAGSHYQFLGAHGSSFWEDGEEGGSVHVPSVFLAHRVSHDDTTPGGGRRGGGSALLINLAPVEPTPDPDANEATVAIVDVSFREPGSEELTSQHVLVTYPFRADHIEPTGYFDASDPTIVQKSFVMLNLYMALVRACTSFHAGDGTGAIAVLQRVRAAVVDYNEELYDGSGDDDMTADLELVDLLIEVLVANGAEPPDSVDIPQDPWPAD